MGTFFIGQLDGSQVDLTEANKHRTEKHQGKFFELRRFLSPDKPLNGF